MSIKSKWGHQYERVIPRDFFNEAKLLKCMGHLSLLVHDRMLPEGINIVIKEPSVADGFKIYLQDAGYLVLINYATRINGHSVIFKTQYNSKSPYPFFVEVAEGEEYEVFDENGNFTADFIEFSKNLQPV